MNQDTLLKLFEQGAAGIPEGKTKHASNMFAEWERGKLTIYSYGKHFPLAIDYGFNEDKNARLYLLNGDRYSPTTSQHQGRFMGATYYDSPRVSFSALRAAGIDPWKVDIIDTWRDQHGPTEEKQADGSWKFCFENETSPADPPDGAVYVYFKNQNTNGNGATDRRFWHRIGSVLLHANNACYLCSMDEGSYFVSKLPGNYVGSIQAAFDALKPSPVRIAEREGSTVLRQGEWFFVPVQSPCISVNAMRKAKNESVFRMHALPRLDVRQNRHVCTRVYIPGVILPGVKLTQDAEMYVTGIVRHRHALRDERTRQHRALKLDSGTVYRVYVNEAQGSWSSDGKVD